MLSHGGQSSAGGQLTKGENTATMGPKRPKRTSSEPLTSSAAVGFSISNFFALLVEREEEQGDAQDVSKMAPGGTRRKPSPDPTPHLQPRGPSFQQRSAGDQTAVSSLLQTPGRAMHTLASEVGQSGQVQEQMLVPPLPPQHRKLPIAPPVIGEQRSVSQQVLNLPLSVQTLQAACTVTAAAPNDPLYEGNPHKGRAGESLLYTPKPQLGQGPYLMASQESCAVPPIGQTHGGR